MSFAAPWTPATSIRFKLNLYKLVTETNISQLIRLPTSAMGFKFDRRDGGPARGSLREAYRQTALGA